MGGRNEWTKRLSDATTKKCHQFERKGTEVKEKEGIQHCSGMASCPDLLFSVWNTLAPSPTVINGTQTRFPWGGEGFSPIALFCNGCN